MIERIKGFWNNHSKEILIIGVFLVFIFAGQSNYKIAATVSTANEVIEEKDVTAEAWKEFGINERAKNKELRAENKDLERRVRKAWMSKNESDSINEATIKSLNADVVWLKIERKKHLNEIDSLNAIIRFRDRVRYVPGGGNEP